MAGFWDERMKAAIEGGAGYEATAPAQKNAPSVAVNGASDYLKRLINSGLAEENIWKRKYQGKSYQELAPILDTLEAGEEKNWLAEYALQVDQDEKRNLDLNTADEEIRGMEDILRNAKTLDLEYNSFRENPLLMLTQGDTYRNLEQRYDAFAQEYGSLQDLKEQIDRKRQYRAEASQLQQKIQAQRELEEWKKTVRDSGSIQKEMDALNAQMESLQGKLNTAGKAAVFGNAGIDLDAGDAMGAGAAASGRMTAIGDIQKSIRPMQQRMEELERELHYSKLQEYAALMQKADFAEKSRYVPTENARGKLTLSGEYVTGDNKYDYINKNPQTVMEQTVNEQLSGAALVGMGMDWLQTMTQEEVAVYNYLHATKGKEQADEFIAFLRPDLTARQRQGMETTMGEMARENPYSAAMMSAISVGMAPMRGISLIGQAADYLTDGKIDHNAGYNQFSYAPTAIRNEVTQMIQESGKWGPAGSFAYQTAMSMGDFLINAGVGMGISGVSTAIMGSGAAADTVIRGKDNGLSDGQAFGLGVVAGLAEALTERFSLEALLDADLLKNGIGVYMLKNSLTEGSEEVASSIINMAADIVVTKEKSEWQKTIRKYQEQGYSEGEAFGKAMAEQAASLGMDFLGGALSGGIMSGANSAAYYADTKRTGRAMGRRGLTDAQQVQQILDEGANAGKGTAANAVASQIQKKVDAGGELSAYDKGRLYQSNPQAVGEVVSKQGYVTLAHNRVQGIDNTMEDWKTAQRLSNFTGRDIKFYNGDPNEDGQYDPKTGEIFINVDRASKHQVAYVFAHELTHSTEIGESYGDLLTYIRAKVKAEGRDWNRMIQEKKEAYADQGHPLETDADAEAELVAVEVQKRILVNEQEMYDLFVRKPTIGQKILNWFDRMAVKFRDDAHAKERLFVYEAQQKLRKAKEDADLAGKRMQQPQRDGESQREQSHIAESQDEFSQMTDDELDDWLDYEEHEAMAREGEAELNRQYSLHEKSPTGSEPVRLNDRDLDEYLYAGGRRNKNKLDANAEGKKVILTSDEEIAAFISDSIDKKAGNTTVAYGKVTERLADDVLAESNGNISIQNYYLELIPTDLQHAYEQHSNAKEYGDIDLSREDFERIPEYLDTYTELLYAIRYASGNVRICVSKELPDGHILIIETVSKSRGAIQFKNAIGVSKQKYEFEYLNKYKKRAETSARGSKSSNISLRDSFNSTNSIEEANEKVNRKMSLNDTGRVSSINKHEVARDLRAILSRGGDPRELQRYVDSLEQTGRNAEQMGVNRYQIGGKRYQSGGNRNSTAREILEAAHSQGIGVEEYLRWNPEEFEVDGHWRSEALEAMRLEQGGRKYSLNQEDSNIPEETGESQARVIQREHLPTKARSYLARAESTLLNRIGEALSVPRYARYNNLKGIIQEISDVYLADGTISDEKMAELFDKAYAEGIVADSAFYDQYKEIKDHLRTYGVTLSEHDRSDIADFDDFRKRAFGTIRILNEGGVPVDTAYGELHTMAPELFPESITHPADQLVRMFEVGQSIAISKKSLDEYYGPERDEFRRWAKNDFDAAVGDAFRDLRQVRRYAEEEGTKEETRKILTTEDAEEAFQELKRLRRNVDKVRAKNLLTESDEILLGRMLKGEIGPQHLNHDEDNVKGITALYEAKLAYESQVELLAAYKRSVRAKRLQEADQYLETATGWKDKRAGILYARETMRRNILDIVPDRKLAERIADIWFEPVHIQEAKATKFKNEYRDRVRALNLSTRVKKGNLVSEAHAVQLLGEAMDNIRVMENARGRMGMRDGKTLAEWRAVVDDLWMNNTGLDRQKIERAVEEFRKIYDELFQQMNRIRVENGYEPVNYRQGYFPHFQPGGDGIMAFFGKVMGINTQVDALPTTINGLTHTFKPGIQWFGNAQERIGFNTAYDAVEGFDKYIEGVASVIFQTENIQKLRALATQVRYRTSDEGIRKQVDAVRMDDRLTDEEKQREINAIYEHGRFALSNFVAELDEYTNLLANKKSKYDRTMESLIGRRAYTMMKAWENRVGANMIAGNLSSALTNFIPMTQASAQLDSGMMLKGMWDTLKNMRQGDGLASMSDFLTNRRGSDVLVRTWMQKASGVLGTPMELIDNFTSESIVRAAYLQNLKRGMSEAEAMHQADIFASGLMADRSKGAMPTLFESRNPLFKAFTQFQLEVNNQFSEVFKDLPRNHRERGLAMLALVLLKYFLGAWMYNELFEKIIGRRSALDPIGILMEAGEDLTGYEIPNLFDLVTGKEKIEKTGEGSIGEAGANLATNVLSELPFSAGLTLVGVETDGGRLPAASSIVDFSKIWDASRGYDRENKMELTADQRWKMIQDELNKLAYVVPPFGGAQISKSWKGIDAYLQGGSHGMDKNGEEILQYPVYKDDPDDAFWSLVRAAFLGKNSLPEAQEWVDSGYDSLNAKQTAIYRDLLDAGVKDRTAFELIRRQEQITDSEGRAEKAKRAHALFAEDIPGEAKAIVYYGFYATENEQFQMDELAELGVEPGAIASFVHGLWEVGPNAPISHASVVQERLFNNSALTEEEKHVAMKYVLGERMTTEEGNPSAYAKYLSAVETGLSNEQYMRLRAFGTHIDKYFELFDAGIRSDDALNLAMKLDTVENYENNQTKWFEECEIILDSGMTEEDQVAALEVVSYPSTGRKIRIGYENGLPAGALVYLKQILPDFDENGNGSYNQAEVTAAIDAINGDENPLFALTGTSPHGFVLTDDERAILWQLQADGKDGKKNPYNQEIGKMIYDLVHADDSNEELSTEKNTDSLDIANLLSKGK